MKELLLDANVLVRFLVQDEPKQCLAATALFAKAEQQELVLHLDALVVAEAVYVLNGYYNQRRSDVVSALLAIVQNAGIQTAERELVIDALRRFGAINVDFADAWLAARSARLSLPLASFDRDFDKFTDIQRFEPGD